MLVNDYVGMLIIMVANVERERIEIINLIIQQNVLVRHSVAGTLLSANYRNFLC
jgi:hypothetical protein